MTIDLLSKEETLGRNVNFNSSERYHVMQSSSMCGLTCFVL